MCAMASPIMIIDELCGRSGQRARTATTRPSVRLVDPGFLCEPSVIDVADWAMGAAEKHRAAPKALAIGLDAGGDRTSGLRAFDHDNTHVSLSWIWFCRFLKQEAGRLDCAFCRCGYLGASRTCPLFDRAWDRMLVAGLAPTGRVALLNEPWT
jgi:hypothetical protein